MPRPRQFARRPAVWSGSISSDGVPFLTKIYFSSGCRGKVPSGSDLSDTPDYNFVTKVDFSSRGLSDGSAGRYLIARHSHSPDENRPCFRSDGQTGGCSDLAHWVCSAVPSVENFSLHLYALHPNLSVLWVKILLRLAGACPCLLREYVRYLIGMIFYFTAHQNSICLSLLYAKFALPMDMTTIISEVTSPAFPIDMTII